MKREEVLVDQGRMYALVRDPAGHLFLEVVVGGFAMENLVVPLTDDEEAAYRLNGKPELDDLAFRICKDPKVFRCRIKQNPPGA